MITICSSAQALQSSTASASANFIAYPLHYYLSNDKFNSSYKKYLVATAVIPTPYTYKQACTDSNWLQAMKVELNALENNHTWDIVLKPPNKHIVDFKWLFKVKYLPNGCIELYKARLVAKSFTQTYGLDYFKTFAPVAKMTTVRLLIAIPAAQNWSISQLDVRNAFLHGDIHEEIYMKLPPGYLQLSSCTFVAQITDPSAFVCKLRKSLYGLRQAPRCWFVKFSNALKEYGFTQSHSHNRFVYI